MLYFDHNATTPLLPEAREAWVEAVERYPGNPSSQHRMGSRADHALTQAREQLAAFLDCHALEIVWTASATESANMVLHHCAQTLPTDSEVWISALEHPCVIESARRWFPGRHRLMPATPAGVLDLDRFESELSRGRPGLVALMAANNETGVLQPWREALALCRDRGVPFFCDAAQWLGKLPAAGLGECDFVSGCAHKFGGPKGAAFLKVPDQGLFHALVVGGPQEERRRSGTENVAGILSLMAALEHRENLLSDPAEIATREAWRDRFIDAVLQHLPGSRILGATQKSLWNTVAAIMPEADCRIRWVVKLDKAGCAVSTGSACSSGKEEPSHVLAAMGCSAAEAGRALRFSSGWETTEDDWSQLLKSIVQVHNQIAS